MQWFVETTVVTNGVAQKALVDVVPLMGPVLQFLHATEPEGYQPSLLRSVFSEGHEDIPAPKPAAPAAPPTELVVLGWNPGSARQKIGLMKLVRHSGKFSLSLEGRHEQERNELFRELDMLCVRWETR
jgi:hypothetical protein